MIKILTVFPTAMVHLETLPAHLLLPLEPVASAVLDGLFGSLNSKVYSPLASELLVKFAPLLKDQHVPRVEQLLCSSKNQEKILGLKLFESLRISEVLPHHTKAIGDCLHSEGATILANF